MSKEETLWPLLIRRLAETLMILSRFAITLLALGISCCEQARAAERKIENVKKPGTQSASVSGSINPGRALFLKNCAHCHGADARGDEGPDLHKLDWTEAEIASRIRKGKKGQMTAFAGKLTAKEIDAVVAYVRSLK